MDKTTNSNTTSSKLALKKETLQQLKAQVSAERILDHLAITLAHASCADLHPFQDLLVESYCRTDLWHLCIMASR